MTSVTGNNYLDSLSNKTATAAAVAKSGDKLDQTAFLKLMTTQLQTQDPFNPVDNTQMVAQMAQFSSVAGIAEMNNSLKTISDSLAGSRIGDAASWIGRAALVTSDVATPLADGSYAGQIDLPEDATDVAVSLIDANGAAVHSESLGARAKGTSGFSWNGKDASGAVVATGPLRLVISATGASGSLAADTATWTQIAGVHSPAGGSAAKLVTGLGLVAPEEALSLS